MLRRAARIAALRVLALSALPLPATAGGCVGSGAYTFSASAACTMDYYVPENLLRLSERADAERLDTFMRKLGCWSEGDGDAGRITCQDAGELVHYDWQRQEDYRREAILVIVPDAFSATIRGQ